MRALSVDAAAMVIQAFVSSWLDYCNLVLNGITENLFQRLQSVQNAAARLITQRGRREHITNITGYLFDAVWNSSWPFSCTRLYTVSHRRTYLMTVCWWRKSADV